MVLLTKSFVCGTLGGIGMLVRLLFDAPVEGMSAEMKL